MTSIASVSKNNKKTGDFKMVNYRHSLMQVKILCPRFVSFARFWMHYKSEFPKQFGLEMFLALKYRADIHAIQVLYLSISFKEYFNHILNVNIIK